MDNNQDAITRMTRCLVTSRTTTLDPIVDHLTQTKILNETTDELRNTYLEMIEKNTWQTDMVQAAINMVPEDERLTESDSVETTVQYNGDSKTFNGNGVIIIGRMDGCQQQGFKMSESTCKSGTSRVHCIIVPSKTCTYIVDLGSFRGIKTVRRGSNKECENSLPTERKLLMIDPKEFCVLNLAGEVVALFPTKECIICMDKYRSYKFPCGHFSTCDDCTNNLNPKICPICRQPFNLFNLRRDMYTKTMPFGLE